MPKSFRRLLWSDVRFYKIEVEKNCIHCIRNKTFLCPKHNDQICFMVKFLKRLFRNTRSIKEHILVKGDPTEPRVD